MIAGTHGGKIVEFYGVLREVIELVYNSSLESHSTVVLLRCDWYNQVGKSIGINDDRHYKSIKIGSF
jgi:hypothetical protein